MQDRLKIRMQRHVRAHEVVVATNTTNISTNVASTEERLVDRVLNQKEAATLLGLSTRTLEQHRVTGTGLRFTKLGRLVRYRQCDLADFVERNLRSSTSEAHTNSIRNHIMQTLVVGLDGLVLQLTGSIILVEFTDMAHISSEFEAAAAQLLPQPGEPRDATGKLAPEIGLVLWELSWRLQQQAEVFLDGDDVSASLH